MRTFFIIGAQRSGTTSLAQMMSRCPEVGVLGLEPPERRIFLRHADPHAALAELWGLAAPGVRWMGCKSTTYLERPVVADRIHQVAPDAQVIVMLRDPILRAISNYHFTQRHGLEDLPIDIALLPEAADRPWDSASISTSPFDYLGRSRYADLLRPWLQLFPNTMTFVLEDILSGADTLQRLAEHMSLELDDFALAWTHENQSSAEGAEPSEATVQRLRDYFADPNRDLESLLGRRITAWG